MKRETALLVGRCLLVMSLLWGGFVKIRYLSGTAAYMKETGMPCSGEPLALAAGLIEFVGAILIMVGCRTREAAVVLLVYLIPVTWYSHLAVAQRAADAVTRDNEMFQTLRNVAIMGGLILLWVLGSGAHSLDARGAMDSRPRPRRQGRA